MASFANAPSLIETMGTRFLIVDAPSEANLDSFVRVLRQHKATRLVRVCEPTYDGSVVEKSGIIFHDLPFPDGSGPPRQVVDHWLDLLVTIFGKKSAKSDELVAIHCLAGLGRAPVMVGIALIEKGMDPLDAVDFIRSKRRGAINMKQLRWLENYKPRGKGSGCIVQ